MIFLEHSIARANMSIPRLFLLLVGFGSVLHGSELRSAWHQLEANNRQNLWFITFEEAAFIRNQIGDWLPIGLYKTGKDQAFRWKIESAVRAKNQCKIVIIFTRQDGKLLSQAYEWRDSGPDGDLTYDISSVDSGIFIVFKQDDQSTRRLWIRRSLSVEELSERIRISRARLSWKWENLRQVDL